MGFIDFLPLVVVFKTTTTTIINASLYKKNRAHKIHLWKVLCMLIASETSFGSKKVTDTACTTLGSGQHGL